MLPVPGFFDCSWAECDVDKDRPTASLNALERANLLLEGYFRALYVPLGGSKTRMEIITFESMKFYISMFSDKPPCIPLALALLKGAAIVLPKVAGAFLFFISFFLASTAAAFSSFLASMARAFSLAFSSCLAFFFHFLFLLSLLLPLSLLS